MFLMKLIISNNGYPVCFVVIQAWWLQLKHQTSYKLVRRKENALGALNSDDFISSDVGFLPEIVKFININLKKKRKNRFKV